MGVNSKHHFTASEWKAFLVYYAPATLYGILPDEYYLLFMLLVKAIRILLCDHILLAKLVIAERLLKKFYKRQEQCYGSYIHTHIGVQCVLLDYVHVVKCATVHVIYTVYACLHLH